MELHLIAHNLRSAQNVGALFRTADSIGISKIWLTGYTPRPDHPRFAKVALGAQESIPWEVVEDVSKVIDRLRHDGLRIVGLELDPRATSLVDYSAPSRIALILGSEVEGLSGGLRDACDDLIYIPQHGVKESMNVSIATAIASFWLLNRSSGILS